MVCHVLPSAHRSSLLCISLVLFGQFCTSNCDKGFSCEQGHTGELFHVLNHADLSKGCNVTAVLKKDCLEILRQRKQTFKIDLESIETPIHIVPNDQNCFSVKHARHKTEIF